MKKRAQEGDLRVRRTRKHLWMALMALFTERDFDALTVNDICERAMVHRTTFYGHFHDKYDLLDTGLTEMYEELRAGLTPPHEVLQVYDPTHPPTAFVGLFEHIVDQKAFYAAMLKGSGVTLFRDHVQSYLIQASLQRLKLLEAERGPALVPIELMAHADTGAILSAVMWWASRGFRLKPAEFATHCTQLLGYGTLGAFPPRTRATLRSAKA